MSALSYLFFKKLKNRFKEYFRSPSKLLLFLAMTLFFGFTVYVNIIEPQTDKQYRSIDEFLAIVFLIYTMLFVDVSKNGFSNGASFFTPADINIIFVSPLKSADALFYGIVQQLGKSLYMGAIILLQYTVSRQYYGIGPGTIVFVALGYGITVFLSQICSMLIYIFTASSDKKARKGKIIYYSVLALFMIYIIIKGGVLSAPSLSGIVSAVRSPVMKLMPVSGIVSLFIDGAVKKNTVLIIIGIVSIVLFAAVFYLMLSKVKGDYYEDVLKSTEVSASAITASKEGTSFEGAARNIKVGKTGFRKGFGASAISEKHKIENRRGKLIFLNRSSIITLGTTVVYSLIIQGDAMMAFVLSLYTLMLGISVGRWMKEITSPYIYLIPERPFKKLIHVVLEQIPAIVFESVLLFAVLHFMLRLSFTQTLFMTLARIGFGFTFIGSNLLYLRIVGKTEKTVYTVMIYILISMICALPSAFLGVFSSLMFWAYPEFGYLMTLPVNILIFFLLLFICRNVLEYSEFNNK